MPNEGTLTHWTPTTLVGSFLEKCMTQLSICKFLAQFAVGVNTLTLDSLLENSVDGSCRCR